MLEFKAFDFKDNSIHLPEYIDFKLSQEENVPADYLEVTFPYFKESEAVRKIRLFEDGQPVFCGLCDEILSSKSVTGTFTKLYFRNMFGVLIDNEAVPAQFNNATAYVIFEKYIKQYGFEKFIADNKPLTGEFNIQKGTSVYNVLSEFCRLNYGCVPYLIDEKTISFTEAEKEKILCFSDGSNQCLSDYGYYKIELSKFPCRLISKVKVKTSEKDFYKTIINNQNAMNKGIVRERCIDACSENTPMSCAGIIIENSNKKYEEYKIYLHFPLFNVLRAKSSISDQKFGKITDLKVSKTTVKADKNGFSTEVTLVKETGYVVA
ncbi:MAG: hypothetical protein ACI4W1_08270 [Ruminococcus sp.]